MEREREGVAGAGDDRALRDELETLQVEVRNKRQQLEAPAPAPIHAELERLGREADAATSELAQLEERHRELEGTVAQVRAQVEEEKVLARGRKLKDLDPQAFAQVQQNVHVLEFGWILAALAVGLPLAAIIILIIVRLHG